MIDCRNVKSQVKYISVIARGVRINESQQNIKYNASRVHAKFVMLVVLMLS